MTDLEVRRLVRDAKAEATRALAALHRLLPRQADITRLHTGGGDTGCASCRRIPGPGGKPGWYNPTEQGERGRRNLCHWCRRIAAARKADWAHTHPGKTPPADDRRWWPPTGALIAYRDQGHVRAGEAQWRAWDAADKKRRKSA